MGITFYQFGCVTIDFINLRSFYSPLDALQPNKFMDNFLPIFSPKYSFIVCLIKEDSQAFITLSYSDVIMTGVNIKYIWNVNSYILHENISYLQEKLFHLESYFVWFLIKTHGNNDSFWQLKIKDQPTSSMAIFGRCILLHSPLGSHPSGWVVGHPSTTPSPMSLSYILTGFLPHLIMCPIMVPRPIPWMMWNLSVAYKPGMFCISQKGRDSYRVHYIIRDITL